MTASIAPTAAQLATEIRAAQAGREGRVVVGFAGAPGSGKSTLAAQVCEELGDLAVLVPLDGWHLSVELTERLGALARRGAPDTFDVAGFVVLLRRIRAHCVFEDGPTIYAPDFRREIEEPVAGAIAVDATTPVVIVEGNYLLLDSGMWREIRPLLDLAYFVHLDDEERRRRLIDRHVRFGKPAEDAKRWVLGSDERNAQLVHRLRMPATRVIRGPV